MIEERKINVAKSLRAMSAGDREYVAADAVRELTLRNAASRVGRQMGAKFVVNHHRDMFVITRER